MIVLTCISDVNHIGYKSGLYSSCQYYNLQLQPLIYDGQWESHRIKDQLIRKFLKTVHSEQIVLFSDGYDTAFNSDATEIIEKFNTFNCKVLFSAEQNCFPCDYLSEEFKPVNSKYRYLNSGGFMGKAGYILKILDNVDADFIDDFDSAYQWSNQYYWSKLYLSGRFDICIDSNCDIFQTFATSMELIKKLQNASQLADQTVLEPLILDNINAILSSFSIQNHRLVNEDLQTLPCHLHFNSPWLKELFLEDPIKQIFPWL